MDIDNPDERIFTVYRSQEETNRLSYYSEALDKLVNIGTHLINFERSDPYRDPNSTAIVYTLFRRIIEMLDASSTLIDAGSINPCKVNLRIVLEALLQLEYFLKDDSLLAIKTKHFAIMDFDSHLELYEAVVADPESRRRSPGIDTSIQEMKDNIAISFFDEIRDDYKSKVFLENGSRKKATIKWYSFTSKANNVKFLAENLGKLHYYTMVYSSASNSTHSTGIIYDGLILENGRTSIIKIRDTSEARDVTVILIKFAKEAFRLIFKRRYHEERYQYLLAIAEFDRRYRI